MLDHGCAPGGRRSAIEIVFENGVDAFVGECPDGQCARRNGLSARSIDAAEQSYDAEAASKALFGMGPIGEYRYHKSFGIRADRCRPAPEALRRPFGITPVCTRHVFWIGAVTRTAVTARMSSDALAAMEDLDCPAGDGYIDLCTDQCIRNRVKIAAAST